MQAVVNDLIREYLDIFCSAYLDNIIIYSDTEEEYIIYIRKVLKAL